jgi:hypothetical protein
VECDAVLWVSRPGPAAFTTLPPSLRGSRVLAVVGALVRYSATPVGPYAEVLGAVGGVGRRRLWGSVSFMAVDSVASLVGGRRNWALPKTLGAFEGEVADGRPMTATGPNGTRWRVSATPTAVGPALPARGVGVLRQQFPGARVGQSTLQARGRVRPALVTVEVESDGPLTGWLRPGRHLGGVVEQATVTLGAPRF